MKREKRIFYGWWVLIAVTAVSFTMAANPFSIILKKLMSEFGTGRGIVSFAPSISTLAGAITGLVIGKMLLHYSPRIIMFWGILTTGVSYFLLGMVNSIGLFFVFNFINGVALSAAGVLPIFTILSKWFNRKWGAAVGITMTGYALGSMVLAPVIAVIAENYGWRITYIFAGFLFIINLPLIIWVIKDNPESIGLLPDGGYNPGNINTGAGKNIEDNKDNGNNPGIKAFSYFKKISFWLVGIGFAFASVGDTAILQHQVSFITDMKIPATIAASAFGFTQGISGIGRMICGWLSDRFSSRYVLILFILITLSGIFILMRAHSMPMVWLFVIVYGFASGASTALLPLVIRDLFGPTAFSILFALMDLFYKGGSTLGTPLAGFIFDITGSYSLVFSIIAVFYSIALVSLYFAFGVNPRPFVRKHFII